MPFIGQTISPSAAPDIVVPEIPCDAGVVVGDWVRINSSSIAVKALADDPSNSHVMGLVEAKASSTVCSIRVSGVSAVTFAGLDPTLEYFLSPTTAGAMTTTVPTGSGHIVLRVGKALNSTTIVVDKGIRIRRAL